VSPSLEEQIAAAQRELDAKRRAAIKQDAPRVEAKQVRRAEQTARQLAANQELARATRLSRAVGAAAYQPTSVYSLSLAGVVRSAMTFRNDETEYSHGSAWNVKTVGVTLEEFVAKYTALGFHVVEHDKPKRVNYDKPVRGPGAARA
jgi:hypothetical protein